MPLQAEGNPDGPQHVVILSYEDTTRYTLKPRIQAAGGDMNLVHVIEGVELGADPETVFPASFKEDLAHIVEAVQDCRAALLFIDPLMPAWGPGVDTNKAGEIREQLTRLKMAAERTPAAWWGMAHLRKALAMDATMQSLGSVEILNAPRSALFVGTERGKDRRAPERILASAKGNLSVRAPSLEYRIVTRPVMLDSGKTVDFGAIEWVAARSDVGVEDLMAALAGARGGPRSGERAQEWVRGVLAAGPREAGDLFRLAEQARIPKRTLQRALPKVATYRRTNNIPSVVLWELRAAADGPSQPGTGATVAPNLPYADPGATSGATASETGATSGANSSA
jgi:hypothetical protein